MIIGLYIFQRSTEKLCSLIGLMFIVSTLLWVPPTLIKCCKCDPNVFFYTLSQGPLYVLFFYYCRCCPGSRPNKQHKHRNKSIFLNVCARYLRAGFVVRRLDKNGYAATTLLRSLDEDTLLRRHAANFVRCSCCCAILSLRCPAAAPFCRYAATLLRSLDEDTRASFASLISFASLTAAPAAPAVAIFLTLLNTTILRATA